MKHLHRLLLAATLFALMLWPAGAAPAPFDHAYPLLDQVLHNRVKDALVNYAALKADPKNLHAALDQMAAVTEAEFNQWTPPQQLAFLINLYNAATLRLIVEHYPVKSIKKIGGLFTSPWELPVVRLFGRTNTLDYLEHGVIRARYDDPRVHFALVCAALGCPPLRGEVYTAGKLEHQLEDQGQQFLATKAKNSIDESGRVLHLSPIFKWYAADFEKKSGSVQKFVTPYFPAGPRAALAQGDWRIHHTDYDWSLNEWKPAR